MTIAGCAKNNGAAANRPPTTLTIGFGENPEVGIRQVVTNIALEGLLRIDRDGRPSPWLAEKWSGSADGLTWRLQLHPNATFHNGQPATASVVRDIVQRELPDYVGPIYDDVHAIRAVSPTELEISLKRRSTFLLEGLDVLIRQDSASPTGTGPFALSGQSAQGAEMRAHADYYLGKPSIDRIVFKPYDSVRSAWADMLRDRVDMLYEVGVDALDSLSASTQTKVFPFQRAYAFLVILNSRNPQLQDKGRRQALNSAIDRAALVAEALDGHGRPADGPVWPSHWAYSSDLPRFSFQPRPINHGKDPIRLRCLVMTDRSHERVALTLQRQLRAVGVELALEEMSSDQLFTRLQAGDFETLLLDSRMGPALLRQYQAWYSGAPYNWGHFSSVLVDKALDQIRDAPDDAAYRAGVAAFQGAVVDDPPAIFLAWGERLRAVSTRFEVPSEGGKDVLTAPVLRLWRPAAAPVMTSRN